MRALQDQVDDVLCTRTRTSRATFTMTGNGQFLASNQGFLLHVPEAARGARRRSTQVAGELMGELGAIPGVFAFLRPVPGAGDQHGRDEPEPGAVRLTRSPGVNPEQVYDAGAASSWRSCGEYPGFRDASPPTSSTTRRISTSRSGATRPRCTASPRRASSTLLRNAYSQNYLYLIKKPDGSVPGHPRGRGRGAREAGGPVAALHQVRRREEPRAARRAGHLEDDRSARRPSIT